MLKLPQQQLTWSPAEQKMHLLLPSVLLLSAGEKSISGPKGYVALCNLAGSCGLTAATHGYSRNIC
jgi:hypothetical protein